jgi:copper chaperone CopZ
MKLLTLLSLLAVAATVRAETTLTMTGVHNCCKGCANGIIKAAADFKDVTVTPEGKKVTITTKKKSDAKKVAEAIIGAGYFGTIEGDESESKSTSKPATAAKPEAKLTKATVSGVHLCCQKCATAATDAVKSVAGVTKYEIVSKAESFTVEGEFAKADLVAALNSAGFAGDIK